MAGKVVFWLNYEHSSIITIITLGLDSDDLVALTTERFNETESRDGLWIAFLIRCLAGLRACQYSWL